MRYPRAKQQQLTLIKNVYPGGDTDEAAHSQSGDLLDNAIRANTRLVLEQLVNTPILSEAVANGHLLIVGGRYDLDTGKVEMVMP